ncbi:cytochrome P450 [Cyathus striatus]|nr:cytochrome P450 [Cyathus striatus]
MHLVSIGLGFLTALYLLRLYINALKSPLHSIPTIGYSGVLTSYITAIQYVFDAKGLILAGYKKYGGEPFKVATWGKWVVLVSGAQIVDEIRRAKDDQLSFDDGVAEAVQLNVIFGPQLLQHRHHIEAVRIQLTRHLASRFADIKDEIVCALTDLIPTKENEWTEIVAFDTILKTVVRTSNRLFVGLPLCRDPDFMDLQQNFTFDLFIAAQLLSIFPKFLRPSLARFTKVPRQLLRAERHIGPLIEERIAKIEELGPSYTDQPNDMINWCLEEAKGYQRSGRDLSMRILAINFAANHTTSMGFTHVLYDLAIHADCVPEMRKEVEAAIAECGWTKEAMRKMLKVDSFIRESARLAGVDAWSMHRKTVKGYTFSNGLFVPARTSIGVPVYAMHRDENLYLSPEEFNPFRFSELNDAGSNGNLRSIKCPGRFFAVNELKAMLAYIVLHYDVKIPTGIRPPNTWFQQYIIPNTKAKVMFRKRC